MAAWNIQNNVYRILLKRGVQDVKQAKVVRCDGVEWHDCLLYRDVVQVKKDWNKNKKGRKQKTENVLRIYHLNCTWSQIHLSCLKSFTSQAKGNRIKTWSLLLNYYHSQLTKNTKQKDKTKTSINKKKEEKFLHKI